MTDDLGYEKYDLAGRDGTRTKTVLTDVGPGRTAVPRDVEGSFDPQVVRKRQRRLTGVDEIVLSLSAKAHREVSAHLAGVYGAETRPSPPSPTGSWRG